MRRVFLVGVPAAVVFCGALSAARGEPADQGMTTAASTQDGSASRDASVDSGRNTAGDAGADGDTDAASGSTSGPKLQGEDEIARRRAEAERDVSDARAARETASQALRDVKRLDVDFKTKSRRLATVRAADASSEARTLEDSLDDLRKQALAIEPSANVDADLSDAVKRADETFQAASKKYDAAVTAQSNLEEEIRRSLSANGLEARLRYARAGRCRTAYCFGGDDGTKYAFEPMLELPIGTSFTIGSGALARFNNATELSIQFSAGLRFWFAYDMVSLSMFFAKPIYSGDVKVRVPGSSFEFPTTSIRRLGPSFALGFVGDFLFLGAGFDELRNGSTPASSDPGYEPNQVVSRGITVTVGIAPFAAIRDGAGALGGSK